MNKQIKTIFVLAFALVMSATSCLNEVSDPNGGGNALPSNVESLDSQVAAMKTSVSEMESMQSTLAQMADYEAIASQFEACAISVKEHIASVEAGMSDVKATLAAMKLQGQIAAATGALKAQVALQDNNDLQAGLLSVEKGVAAWLGKDFKNYFAVAAEQAKLGSMLVVVESQSHLADAIASDVEVGLRVGDASDLKDVAASVKNTSEVLVKLNQQMTSLTAEVEQGYTSAIKSETSSTKSTLKALNTKAAAAVSESTTTLADLAGRISTCETKLEEINTRLDKVETDVAELLGMIQSVSFISKYSEDYAIAYYNMSETAKVVDENLPYNGKAVRTATGAIELDFIVRPAAASTALNAKPDFISVMGYYANRISTKAPNPTDYINFDVTKVVATDSNRGVVTVTVDPNFKEAFYYKEVGAKCALSIKSGKSDITSKFIEILPKDNSRTVYVTGITPSRYSVTLDKGQTIDLDATVTPDDASVKNFHWSSSDPKIVTFDGNTLNAVGVGETTVKVTTAGVDEWGVQLFAEIPVKVNEAFRIEGPRYVEQGVETKLFLTYPTDAIIEKVVWTASDESKITVRKEADGNNGIVTGVADTYNTTTHAYNTVTVFCTINGVTTVSKEFPVAAFQPKAIYTETLPNDETTHEMYVDETFSVASTIMPRAVPQGAYRIIYQIEGLPKSQFADGVINPYYQTVTMEPTVAYIYMSVENVHGENYLLGDVIKKTVIVKVLPYLVKTITLEDLKLEINQSAPLTAKLTSAVAGKNPSITTLTWQSSNENIATVDQNGNVTALSPGNTTITATATDGSGVSGTCEVTVTEPWKEFNVGDYVVRNPYTKEIEFYSSKPSSNVVGIVIAKTNPRATDPMLPESCTHGIAIALGEGEGTWSSDYSQKVSSWAAESGQAFVADDNVYSGYTNTQALKAFISAKGASSGIISALNTYNQNGPGLPNGTSAYYIPSAAEMKDIATLSNGGFGFSNTIKDIGGVGFSNTMSGSTVLQCYWTMTEASSAMQAVAVRALDTVNFTSNSMKSATKKVRYVFAF